MKKHLPILLFAICAFAVTSGGQSTVPAVSGIRIRFENMLNGKPVVLNTASYKNAHGDTFTVSELNYYVSNFRLRRKDGVMVTLPAAYFLIKQSNDSSREIQFPDVPEGSYNELTFLLGVDSTRNISGEQTGALDPANKMFWTWNSGYVFFKLAGICKSSPNGKINFLVGGIKPGANSLREQHVMLKRTLIIKKACNKEVRLYARIDRAFEGKTTVGFSSLSKAMGGIKSVTIADNYGNHLFEEK